MEEKINFNKVVIKKCWYCGKLKRMKDSEFLCNKCFKLKTRPISTKVLKIYDKI